MSDSDELRQLVRELLSELLPSADTSTEEVHEVDITSDSELAAFVAQILDLAADPAKLDRMCTGRLRFRLRHRPVAPAAHASPDAEAPCGVVRIEKGVVTEKMLIRSLETGNVVIGSGAIVTPLAREFARKNGVTLERRR